MQNAECKMQNAGRRKRQAARRGRRAEPVSWQDPSDHLVRAPVESCQVASGARHASRQRVGKADMGDRPGHAAPGTNVAANSSEINGKHGLAPALPSVVPRLQRLSRVWRLTANWGAGQPAPAPDSSRPAPDREGGRPPPSSRRRSPPRPLRMASASYGGASPVHPRAPYAWLRRATAGQVRFITAPPRLATASESNQFVFEAAAPMA
jgi:hypothetical protein